MQGHIDLSIEEPIPLRVFAREVGLHPITLGRHARVGFRGVILETVVFGNRRHTTVQAWHRFIQAMTIATDRRQSPRAVPGRTSRERARATREAVSELADQGA
jgi:hypothetical protein